MSVSAAVIAADFVFIAEARTAINQKWAPLTYACGNSVEEVKHAMRVNRDRWHELKEKGVFDAFRISEFKRVTQTEDF